VSAEQQPGGGEATEPSPAEPRRPIVPPEPVPPRPIPHPEPLDPREGIGRLSDRSPLVLFPVRIETRFVDAESDEDKESAHKLLVRIYPDDCSIDTFEEALSLTEIANAKLYWQQMWRAGGVEDEQRAAWRALVAAHGSGRASYIVKTYAPVNLAEQPVKGDASEELLVIATQVPLPTAEASALETYWQAVWRAGEDAAARQAATAALTTAVGANRAQALESEYAPFNLTDAPTPPATRTSVSCATKFVIFPPDPASKPWSWSQAPVVKQLPERFVVLAYTGEAVAREALGEPVSTPLHVGPDPAAAAPEATIHPEGEQLVIPEELQWMVEFEAAEKAGMGIAIEIDAEQAHDGFDRLLVLGVQIASSDADGKQALEELLEHHRYGLGGLEVLAQGTPTHNSTGASSGYGRGDNSDSEASFDDRKAVPLFKLEAEPTHRRDGQCLAEALGIDPVLLQEVHGAGGEDQLRARAMQRALWPATAGYWMDKMLTPIFGDEMVAQARSFFAGHVRGRGAVPALRIGGQPYGILPTTAFSRIAWLSKPLDRESELYGGVQPFMVALLALLRKIEGDWKSMAEGAAYVGDGSDAQQTLLDIIGLQSGSAEYHWRYSESLTELYNIINLWGLGPEFWDAFAALLELASGEELLQRLGWDGTMPKILEHAFMADAGTVTNVIDDRPLSESEPIRAYTEQGENYIQWLIKAANVSLDALREEQGFSGGDSPQMLLYLFLRQALLLGYYDTAYELYRSAGFMSAAELQAMKPEPPFIHVDADATTSESRYAPLYRTESRITQSPTLLVTDYITQQLKHVSEAAGLVEQLEALEALATAPTAQLERVFAEHIDTCSYRFDAWLLGLVDAQLEQMRAAPTEGQPATPTGVYLGAYAWVEDLRPSQAKLEAVSLPEELESTFAASAPLVHDPGNGGYVLAPSLTHARTAAVLRSGYLANATPENPETLSVNLSSERVRVALALLEGIRNGQSLGALLGYNFERGLHDDYGLAEVEKFVYPLRKAFPLVADSLASTATEADVPIEAIEAHNVLDGRKLADHIRESANATYPFGLTHLPAATAAESQAIDEQANALLDAYDAVADLALAEGVHQAVQGNFDRVAATLDAYSSGTFPPDPEVVQTPAPGLGLTHRVALQFEPVPVAPAGATPRATAEPALDAWLAGMLPQLSEVACTVAWRDPVGGAERSLEVTLAELALHPLDVLELLKLEDVQAMRELDDRIVGYALQTAAPRPDAALEIRYRSAGAGKISMFAASALVQSLRTLLQGARALRATDAVPPGEATQEHNSAVFAERSRVADPLAQLEALQAEISKFVTALQTLLANPAANRATLVAGVDGYLDEAVALLERAASFGVPQTGWGFTYEWRRAALSDLLAAVAALVAGWQTRLEEFDKQLAEYDALPAGTEEAARFAMLQKAEALVTLVLATLPSEPATMRAELNGKRAALANAQAAYAATTSAAYSSFHEALEAVQALLPSIAAFNSTSLELAPFEERALDVLTQLASALAGHLEAIEERGKAARAQLVNHDQAAAAQAKVEALQAGAKALLGESFTLIPEFGLTSAQSTAWTQALAASTSGELLQYLTKTLEIGRPVQEWLCGAARVRPALRTWEACATLAGIFGRAEPALMPAQIPYQPGEPWLAMQFPAGFTPSSEPLLYTACYATAFDAAAHQCGLLIDEWTEVIPSTTKDAGLTFNFARPDNEAPQAILVVTPASASGVWEWADVVGALNETLDLAKRRALEPAQIEPTAYARLLPATIMAVTLYGISITTSMAVADGVLQQEEIVNRA
jgi:hypothetical protein